MLPSLRSLALVSLLAANAVGCAKPPTMPDPVTPTPVTPQPTVPTPPSPPPAVTPPTLAVTKFMAFGDSLTEGEWWPGLQYYDPAFTHAYPTFLLTSLQARYATQQFVMVNEGLGGYRAVADSVGGRFVSALITHNPQVVLLLQGVTDLYDSPNTAGIESIVRALRDDIRAARLRNVFVFISTLTAERDPNPGGIDDPGYKDRHWLSDALLQEANTAIKNMVASEAGVTLVDGYAVTAADPGRLIGADGLHLTIEGYQALAAAFFDAIKDKYEVSSTVAPATVAAPLSARPR